MPKTRVLVVDDSVVVRRLVSDELAADPDIEVAGTAANGRIALAKLPQLNPDLVTLDVEMPELDGLEFIRAARSRREYDPVRIMMVTTETEQEQLVRALEAGANEYMMKPFTRDILVAKLGLLDVLGGD